MSEVAKQTVKNDQGMEGEVLAWISVISGRSVLSLRSSAVLL